MPAYISDPASGYGPLYGTAIRRRRGAPPDDAIMAAQTAAPPPPPIFSYPTMGPIHPLSTQLPVYGSEAERNFAYDSGFVDPAFPTPRAKTFYEAATKREIADNLNLAAVAKQNLPFDSDAPLERQVAAQLAGDMRGDTKRVLQSLNGLSPDAMTPLSNLLPFGNTTFGGNPTDINGITPRLDEDLLRDPEFKRILTKDPARAAFVYSSLTGRDYGKDVEAYTGLKKAQGKVAFDFARNQLAQGATRDPVTGDWIIWNPVVPEGEGGLAGSARPTRMPVKATPQQRAWMEEGYANVMGEPLPELMRRTAKDEQGSAALMKDPAIQAAISAKRAELGGRQLTHKEELLTARLAVAANQRQEDQNAKNMFGSYATGGAVPNIVHEFANAVTGFKPGVDVADKLFGADPILPHEMNWWGKILQKAVTPAVDLVTGDNEALREQIGTAPFNPFRPPFFR